MPGSSSTAAVEKATAICLQVRPWRTTSHVVTWLTKRFGKIVTPVKGATRAKSFFLGQYDVAYTCELLFYRRDRGGLHAIREVAPMNLRLPLRENWRSAHAAGYLCALAASVSVPHDEAGGLFQLLTTALDLLERSTDPMSVVLWFEIKLLTVCGLAPDLTLCPDCVEAGVRWHRFSLPSGRFVCSHSGAGGAEASGDTVSVDHRLYRVFRLYSLSLMPPKRPAGEYENSFLGFCRFLGIFVKYHLDVPPAMRRVAVELLFNIQGD